jgi:hypothetical protein
MTGKPQSIDPHGDKWAGDPQCVFVRVCHRKAGRITDQFKKRGAQCPG